MAARDAAHDGRRVPGVHRRGLDSVRSGARRRSRATRAARRERPGRACRHQGAARGQPGPAAAVPARRGIPASDLAGRAVLVARRDRRPEERASDLERGVAPGDRRPHFSQPTTTRRNRNDSDDRGARPRKTLRKDPRARRARPDRRARAGACRARAERRRQDDLRPRARDVASRRRRHAAGASDTTCVANRCRSVA